MSHFKSLKRKRFNQPEEIAFDFSARQDYLTGFHKRKLERAKHALDISIRKAKEIKLETRRQLRAERKAELERYVKSVDEMIAKDDESWGSSDADGPPKDNGTHDEKLQPLDHEDNYSDEDRYTTVLIEEVDVTRQGLKKLDREEEEDEANAQQQSQSPGGRLTEDKGSTSKKRRWTKNAPNRDKTKKKRPRYEAKAERKITRSKERSGGMKAKAKRKGRYT